MGSLDLSSHGAIILGIFVGIVSTSIQSLGLTLQRKSHLIEDQRPTQRPPYRRRRWQIGMGLFITSNILGSSVQIGTLPLVILSPLQASGLVFNSICASVLLGEKFTQFSFVGTVLVCIGAALIAIFGAIKEPVHNLDELISLLHRTGFLMWLIAQILIITCLLLLGHISRTSKRANFAARWRMLRGLAYGSISGILSADSLLLAKSAVELLIRSFLYGDNQFTSWPSWVILIGLVSTALCQLFYLHRGLKLCSTSVLYPLVFCVYNIFAILNGLIYYNQADRLTTLSSCLIALGVAILLSGVLSLSWRLEQSSQYPPDAISNPITEVTDSNEILPIVESTNSPTFSQKWSKYFSIKPKYPAGIRRSPTTPSRYGSMARRRTLTETREILAELESEPTPDSQSSTSSSDTDAADERTSLLTTPPRPHSG
ncbi:hypothetical protein ABW19_dt0203154 [Dactylella cylindrospora]|nr:hypothetical protein ABW19_dt0203154 [Dactylella cylindrospora]